MQSKWKRLANTDRPAAIQRWANWLIDKENRATLTWLGSLLGIGVVLFYQMTLDVGFTPQVNLAEGVFVLAKAAITGVLVFGALYVGVFAPALSLRAFDIDVDAVRQEHGHSAIQGLLRRCFCAQMFGGLFPAALVLLGTGSQSHHFWLGTVLGFASVMAMTLALTATRLPGESRAAFYAFIPVVVMFSAFSFLMFMGIVSVQDDVASWVAITAAWCGLMLAAAILGTARRRAWLATGLAALLMLVALLGVLGQLHWALRAIANIVGIAQAGTVTLVVPENACPALRAALKGIEELPCSGDDAGTLRKAEVLNDWGSRWLVKLSRDGKTRTISFDGNGTIISIDEPNLTKNPAKRRE